MGANAAVRTAAKPEIVRHSGVFRPLLAAMRPHQWVKNLFVLAPVLFSQTLDNPGTIVVALGAFLTFCLLSSTLYIVNDIIDAPADRQHPDKRFRPIASGALSARVAALAAATLFATAVPIAVRLGTAFSGLAGLYFASTVAYCLLFKRTAILDCLLIASGFVLRVVGGAVAISVVPSHWLIVCAFLLALYLAFSKRRQELLALTEGAARHRAVLGEYTVTYLDQVNTVLLSAVIVCYALYTVAPDTVQRFGTDALLYGTVFVLYGLLRYMALSQTLFGNTADAGKVLLRDKPLLVAIAGWAFYNTVVIYWNNILHAVKGL